MPRVKNVRVLFKGLAATVIVVFCASGVMAAEQEPPLPAVTMSRSDKTEGELIAHFDGFWYAFEDAGTLTAIPDAEAGTVRIYRPACGC